MERKPEEETVFDMLGKSSDDSGNKNKKVKSRSLVSTQHQHHPVNARVMLNGLLGSNNTPKIREQSIAFQSCREPVVFHSYSDGVLENYSKFDESLIERIFPSYSSSFI